MRPIERLNVFVDDLDFHRNSDTAASVAFWLGHRDQIIELAGLAIQIGKARQAQSRGSIEILANYAAKLITDTNPYDD